MYTLSMGEQKKLYIITGNGGASELDFCIFQMIFHQTPSEW